MIVQMTVDDIVREGVAVLKSKDPNENEAVTFASDTPFLLLNNRVRRERDGSLPTRISLVGHSAWSKFGNLSAGQLVNAIVKELDAASALQPELLPTLASLDLFGCHSGLVDEHGHSLAHNVANGLYDAGYNIVVKSFTNLELDAPSPAYRMSLEPDEKTGEFIAYIYRTRETKNEYSRLIAESEQMRRELAPTNSQLLQIRSYEKKHPLNDDEKKLVATKKALETKSAKVTQEINKRIADAEKLKIQIMATTSARDYLDTHPKCHFLHEKQRDAKRLASLSKQLTGLTELKAGLIQSLNDSSSATFAALIDSLLVKANSMPEKAEEKFDSFIAVFRRSGIPLNDIDFDNIPGDTSREKRATCIRHLLAGVESHTAALQERKNSLEPGVVANNIVRSEQMLKRYQNKLDTLDMQISKAKAPSTALCAQLRSVKEAKDPETAFLKLANQLMGNGGLQSWFIAKLKTFRVIDTDDNELNTPLSTSIWIAKLLEKIEHYLQRLRDAAKEFPSDSPGLAKIIARHKGIVAIQTSLLALKENSQDQEEALLKLLNQKLIESGEPSVTDRMITQLKLSGEVPNDNKEIASALSAVNVADKLIALRESISALENEKTLVQARVIQINTDITAMHARLAVITRPPALPTPSISSAPTGASAKRDMKVGNHSNTQSTPASKAALLNKFFSGTPSVAAGAKAGNTLSTPASRAALPNKPSSGAPVSQTNTNKAAPTETNKRR
jgi:hypothetical protein